jgi:hypothetical protein
MLGLLDGYWANNRFLLLDNPLNYLRVNFHAKPLPHF